MALSDLIQTRLFLCQWKISAVGFKMTHIWTARTSQNWTERGGVPTSCCSLLLSLALFLSRCFFLSSLLAPSLLLSACGVLAALLFVKLQHHRRYLFPKFLLKMCLEVRTIQAPLWTSQSVSCTVNVKLILLSCRKITWHGSQCKLFLNYKIVHNIYDTGDASFYIQYLVVPSAMWHMINPSETIFLTIISK